MLSTLRRLFRVLGPALLASVIAAPPVLADTTSGPYNTLGTSAGYQVNGATVIDHLQNYTATGSITASGSLSTDNGLVGSDGVGGFFANSFTGDGSNLTHLTPGNLDAGTAGISITGNAATVTNGLYSTGSYLDPAWLTGISGSIVSGTVDNASTASYATDAGTAAALTAPYVSGLTAGTGISLSGSTGAVTASLATVAGFPWIGGDSTDVATISVDAYGRIASASVVPIAFPVTSVAGHTGAVTLGVADVAGAAPLASPAFTGTPTAPTQGSSDNSTDIATTAWVKSLGFSTTQGTVTQVSANSPLSSSGGAAPIISLSGIVAAANGGTGNTTDTAALVSSPDGTRNAGDKLPTTDPNAVRYDFATASSAGVNSRYAGVMTYAPWDGTTGSTGDASYQLAFGGTAADGAGIPMLNIRKGIDSTWGSWYTLLNSGNYNSYCPTLTGGGASGTWPISISGNAATVTNGLYSTSIIPPLGAYNTTPDTGRTLSEGSGLYTYGYYASGGPTAFGDVIHFGNTDNAAAELAISWDGAPSAYIRSLRDVGDNWTGWYQLATGNQDVSTSASPTFTNLNLGSTATTLSQDNPAGTDVLRVTAGDGDWVDIGSQNTGWTHITDGGTNGALPFYFGSPVSVNGGISVYGTSYGIGNGGLITGSSLDILNRPQLQATMTAAETITSSEWWINLATESVDVDGWANNNTSDAYEWSVPEAGTYLVTGHYIASGPAPAGDYSIRIEKNSACCPFVMGTSLAYNEMYHSTASGQFTMQVTAIVNLAQGDWLSLSGVGPSAALSTSADATSLQAILLD